MRSIAFTTPVYIEEAASVAGHKEGKGPFRMHFDFVGEDDLFGCDNWDEAESFLQKYTVDTLLKKAHITASDIDFTFAGDLLEQTTASSFGLLDYSIPHFGLYGACSTCGEALSLASILISAGYASKILAVTSSHFASAEVAFRYPLHYGNQRPLSATRTTTGCGAFLLQSEYTSHSYAKITSLTPGRIIDYGITDSMNMGAAMAPAAADSLERHFKELSRVPKDYDRIITGDLGVIGQDALIKLMENKGYDISENLLDCGRLLYGQNDDFEEEMLNQDINLSDIEIPASGLNTNAGGSGCGCSAIMLAAYFLDLLKSKKLHKILFMPTGALLSKNSFQEGRNIPGICHAVSLESC